MSTSNLNVPYRVQRGPERPRPGDRVDHVDVSQHAVSTRLSPTLELESLQAHVFPVVVPVQPAPAPAPAVF